MNAAVCYITLYNRIFHYAIRNKFVFRRDNQPTRLSPLTKVQAGLVDFSVKVDIGNGAVSHNIISPTLVIRSHGMNGVQSCHSGRYSVISETRKTPGKVVRAKGFSCAPFQGVLNSDVFVRPASELGVDQFYTEISFG